MNERLLVEKIKGGRRILLPPSTYHRRVNSSSVDASHITLAASKWMMIETVIIASIGRAGRPSSQFSSQERDILRID
jgi:hypothetical protein